MTEETWAGLGKFELERSNRNIIDKSDVGLGGIVQGPKGANSSHMHDIASTLLDKESRVTTEVMTHPCPRQTPKHTTNSWIQYAMPEPGADDLMTAI